MKRMIKNIFYAINIYFAMNYIMALLTNPGLIIYVIKFNILALLLVFPITVLMIAIPLRFIPFLKEYIVEVEDKRKSKRKNKEHKVESIKVDSSKKVTEVKNIERPKFKELPEKVLDVPKIERSRTDISKLNIDINKPNIEISKLSSTTSASETDVSKSKLYTYEDLSEDKTVVFSDGRFGKNTIETGDNKLDALLKFNETQNSIK